MRLSKLQKNILEYIYTNKNDFAARKDLYRFYPSEELKKNFLNIQTVLQKSLENLIDKEYLTGYGYKTARKWFIQRIKLTRSGRNKAGELVKSKQLKMKI